MSKIEKGGKKSKPVPSPDKLVKAGKKGGAELTEDEMKKISGGQKLSGWID
ncbi:MAG TPA: bacteriocin [Stellaceae bacterium]|nr:bacteriocin [Stellaceae bacterium]